MLTQLHIENIAVIECVDIAFYSGFSVLTGETGAGKSILIDSINLLLGGRAAKDIIRQGCRSAVVSAVFDVLSEQAASLLEGYGLETEDGTLILQRNISVDGKSACRANGRQITVAVLKEIGRLLITFHGQHENNNLLDPAMHIRYLDAFAKNEMERRQYTEAFIQVKKLEKAYRTLDMNEQEKAYKTELLKYQLDEIEKADLVLPGPDEEDEEQRLNREKTVAANRNKILEGLETARSCLTEGEVSAQQLLYEGLGSLSGVVRYDGGLAEFSDRLNEIYENLDALNDDLRDYFYRNYADSDSLDINAIEERLDLIYKLKRKYGACIADILDYAQKCRTELDEIAFSSEKADKLSQDLAAARKKLEQAGARLRETRQQAAKRMESQITAELSFLEMPSVRFCCEINPCNPLENGMDSVEFLMSANAGEPLRPMTKIASGGELSRIMLSIKKVLSSTETVGTLIFDEIDTGVSGRAAQKIAIKLREMAENRQVIVVTHLTQIAALGRQHYLIDKKTEDGRTYTKVRLLDEEGRKLELARILGGLDITEAMLSTAEELLQMAKEKK